VRPSVVLLERPSVAKTTRRMLLFVLALAPIYGVASSPSSITPLGEQDAMVLWNKFKNDFARTYSPVDEA
jgi:hypothetical protein